MSEDESERDTAPPSAGIALGAAAADPALREDLRDYLRHQSQLARIQIADLEREDKVRHRSLRIHHIGDLLKLGFEIAAALVVLAAAAVVAAAVWSAAHDDGLVIEAFNVPSDMAANGLTGQVVATRIQDRLAWMQSRSSTIRAAGTYRNDWGDDIKVQIPNTGVSIGESYRYLASWLGHETHITGEVWRTANGLTLSVRSGGGTAATFKASDLDALIAKASEEVYRRTQPYRYTVFLGDQNRYAEEVAASRALALWGPAEEKPWAYSRWGLMLQRSGDYAGALEKQRRAVALGPSLPHVWWNLADAEVFFGHDEAALRDDRRAQELLLSPAAKQLARDVVATSTVTERALNAEAVGDYREAIAAEGELSAQEDYSNSQTSTPLMMSADLAADHEISASLRASSDANGEAAALRLASRVLSAFDLPPLSAYLRAAEMGDWKAARDDLARLSQTPQAKSAGARAIMDVEIRPLLADAEARLGNFARAHALIDGSAPDCYLCTRVRGNVAAAQKDWNAAGRWYAKAASLGPSLPFADLDWARALLSKGDLDGAVAKLANASAKAPHFADPLELWGEALVARNRSDLALAKFAQAETCAPNWGRLHLKWGEALMWSGDKDGARRQFALARGLDLTKVERAELAYMLTLSPTHVGERAG